MLVLMMIFAFNSCIYIAKNTKKQEEVEEYLEYSKEYSTYDANLFLHLQKHVLLDKNLNFCYQDEDCDNEKIETTDVASASGGVISAKQGKVYGLTAAHFCIDEEYDENDNIFQVDYQKVVLAFFLNKVFAAKIEKIDTDTDLCLISFDVDFHTKRLSKLEIADAMPKIGSEVYTVSSPLGLHEHTFRFYYKGYYSGCSVKYGCLYTIPATHGSSGSLVLNDSGELISIMSVAILPFKQISAGPGIEEIKLFLEEYREVTGIKLP